MILDEDEILSASQRRTSSLPSSYAITIHACFVRNKASLKT